VIRFEGISKRFPGAGSDDVVAVDGFDLEVARGAFATLLGPSGCGKTTTLRMLAGLERPDRGRITIGDRVVFSAAEGIDVPTHQRDVSMVFQSHALWPHMSVGQNVAYPLRVRRVARREVAARVDAALDLVGLTGLASRPSMHLSGGQQQRVALARAVVSEPSVLLLDEPLSSLDAGLRGQMQNELKALQRRIGVTTLSVSHDQHEALVLSDDLVVMQAGTIVQRGSPREVYERPVNRFAATLVGTTNLLAVRSEPGSTRCPFGQLLVPSAGVGTAYVSVRPEAVRVVPDGPVPPGPNVFAGSVRSMTFVGHALDVEVDVQGTLLRARIAAADWVAPGVDVFVVIPPEGCVALSG
jgi:iron(III) transport system ATP-binding protein